MDGGEIMGVEEQEAIKLADQAIEFLQHQQADQAEEVIGRLSQCLLPLLDFKYGYLRAAVEQVLRQRLAEGDFAQSAPGMEEQLAKAITGGIERATQINCRLEPRSTFERLGTVLASLFPSERIYPDYWLGGSRLDFFIPEKRLAFCITAGPAAECSCWLVERACRKRGITPIKLEPRQVNQVNFRQQLARWLQQEEIRTTPRKRLTNTHRLP